MGSPYLVSVRLMVYNHEAYIREAIEGILKQKTTFPIEVVVGDDFSTDNSLAIISEYENTPHIHFKILERKVGEDYWQNRQKIGRLHNFYNILENCSGKYIALLDGDDHWTDPYKLQKQVDFLEKNSDFSICFHNLEILNQIDKKTSSITNSNEKEVSDILDLAKKGNFMFTASVLFKKPKNGFPNWLEELPIGDYPLHLYNAQFGKIKFLDEVMGVYRIHADGIWGCMPKEQLSERWILMLTKIEDKFSPEIEYLLKDMRKRSLFNLYVISANQKNEEKAIEVGTRIMEVDPYFLANKIIASEAKQLEVKKQTNSRVFKISAFILKKVVLLKNIIVKKHKKYT